MTETSTQAVKAEKTQAPATFWQRFLANLVDSLILGVINGVIFGISFVVLFILSSIIGEGGDLVVAFGFVLLTLIVFALSIAYHVFFWIKKGQTPGDQLLKQKIVDNETGELASAGRYWARYGIYFVGSMLGFPYLIAEIIVFFNDDTRRTVTDRICGLKTIDLKED